MSEPLDILCASDMNVDLIMSGNAKPRFGQVEQLVDDYALTIGGSANIFASQFAKLGGRVGLLGVLGDDYFGRFLAEQLADVRVDVSRLQRRPSERTGITLTLVEQGDRAMLTWPGTIDALDPSDLTDDLIGASRHWHVASYFLLTRLIDHWPAWFRRLHEADVTISLDTNWDPDETWRGVDELLDLVDVLLPNEQEAMALSGADNVEEAAERLAKRGPLVVVKCGGDGAVAHDGHRLLRVPVPDDGAELHIVDTVGAGDSFDGGFLRGWLLGWPLERAISLAMRCGAASLGGSGGVEAQLREDVA